MERWRQRLRAHTIGTQKDKADCFKAICRPTLTFPQRLVKISVVSRADWRQEQEQTRALEEKVVRERRGEEGEDRRGDIITLQASGIRWNRDNLSHTQFLTQRKKQNIHSQCTIIFSV